jgi:hypothetical protein
MRILVLAIALPALAGLAAAQSPQISGIGNAAPCDRPAATWRVAN